jgi:hypothetical protein
VTRARLAASVLGGVAALALPGGGRVAGAAPDEQPAPPRIFFAEPDAETRKAIDDLISSSFGDLSKGVAAREVLVRRYGLWSVKPLVERVRAAANETIVRNAMLTLASLRREHGPSPHLWAAVPVLVTTLKTSAEPWRRAFAALSLGVFYGPQTTHRGPGWRDGTRAEAVAAQTALSDADDALVAALDDSNPEVAAAAALAIGKIGGASVAVKRAALRRAVPPPPAPAARIADLLSLGLLPPNEDVVLTAALKEGQAQFRAAAALAIACWAVTQVAAGLEGPAAAAAADRARELDVLLRPGSNVLLRESDVDGAEAAFARGMLALVSGRTETFDELLRLATNTTEERTAIACAQALQFAPRESAARASLVDLLTRVNVGKEVEEPVIAAGLVVAGTDAAEKGVEALREYLRDRSREPRARPDGYDVRTFGALALVRSFAAGRVAPRARELAVRALADAAARGLVPDEGSREAPTFRFLLRETAKHLTDTLGDPDARPSAAALAALEASVHDVHGLAARDPVDVAVLRLNRALHALYGLDSLPPSVVGPGGARDPNKKDQELRTMLGWLERFPYFTRLDLLVERGRVAATRRPIGDDGIDREVSR